VCKRERSRQRERERERGKIEEGKRGRKKERYEKVASEVERVRGWEREKDNREMYREMYLERREREREMTEKENIWKNVLGCNFCLHAMSHPHTTQGPVSKNVQGPIHYVT
jgi:hypothetical protein